MTNGQAFHLAPHPKIHKHKAPLLVIVLDGWGEAEDDQYNAISRADTPCMDSLKKGKPDHWMLLKAHGTAVRPLQFFMCTKCSPCRRVTKLAPPAALSSGKTLDISISLDRWVPFARLASHQTTTWETRKSGTTPWGQAKW